jgi:NADH:ubiquinone oxidoreductase subunit K
MSERIIGIFLLFVFPVGTAVGVGLIVVGWRMGKTHVCSECGNLVHDRAVKICPACKVSFA